jgi:hypothetical protein
MDSSLDGLGLRIELDNGYYRVFNLGDIYSVMTDDAKGFYNLVVGVGLVVIPDTEELHGRLYHGPLIGWTKDRLSPFSN